MNKLIEAVYEQGVLRPVQPLHLREGESVKLVVVSSADRGQPSGVGWNADTARATMRRISDLPREGAADGAPVGREHDRYLYGDLSEFEKGRQQ